MRLNKGFKGLSKLSLAAFFAIAVGVTGNAVADTGHLIKTPKSVTEMQKAGSPQHKPILSAARGAEIAMQQRKAAQTKEAQNRADLSISWDRTRLVQDAIDRISQTDGIKVAFSSSSQSNRVYSTLTVGDKSYAIIIDADESGYAIYEQLKYQEQPSRQCVECEEYEGLEEALGGNQSFEEALGGIAMILGYYYPEYAPAIDQAIGHSQRPTGLVP